MLKLEDHQIEKYNTTEKEIIRSSYNRILAEYSRITQYTYSYNEMDKLVKKSIQIIAEEMEAIMIVTKQQPFINEICGTITRYLKQKGYPPNVINMARNSLDSKYKRKIDHTKEEGLLLETKESKTVYEDIINLIRNIKSYTTEDLTRRQIHNIKEYLSELPDHFDIPQLPETNDKSTDVVLNGNRSTDKWENSTSNITKPIEKEIEKKTPRPNVDNYDSEAYPKLTVNGCRKISILFRQIAETLEIYPITDKEMDRQMYEGMEAFIELLSPLVSDKYRRTYYQWFGIMDLLKDYNISQVAKMTKALDINGNKVGISREYIQEHAPVILDFATNLVLKLPFFFMFMAYYSSHIQPYRDARVSETRKLIANRTVNIS